MNGYRDSYSYYPVALKLKDREVVIVGGNEEATRKLHSLLPCEPRLTVISPQVTGAIAQLAKAGKLRLIKRTYRHGDLDGAFMAIVCTPAVSQALRAEAVERKVLINVLDQAELRDYINVAMFSRDGLQIGIHTSGKSAALSRRIRERLERQLGEEYAALTQLLGEMRLIVKGMIRTPERRRSFWLGAVNAELLEKVENGLSMEALREEILRKAKGYREI
ncbi:MAG: bifunctional precorrin-2 dehydrogenase/sirohydrochlorin ferrochelatase [Candidatus Bipolaricaulia bacterium]